MFSRHLDKSHLKTQSTHHVHAIENHLQINSESLLEPSEKTLPSVKSPKKSGDYIKSAVYGGMDGIITCFAIVTGSHGASLSSSVILILGIASLIGDAISMASGDYLSTKAEIEYQKSEKKREEWEVDNHPEGEKLEMFEIYINKGFSEEDANLMTNIVSKSKKAWVETMMIEELGMVEVRDSPVRNAVITFFSFLTFGILPLLPYFADSDDDDMIFMISIGLVAVALTALGFAKSRVVETFWLKSCLESLVLGSLAAGTTYLLGWVMKPLAD